MTSTTVSARQSETREHRTSAALHLFADMVAAGHIPESTHADLLPMDIPIHVPTELAVFEFAKRMDIPVEPHLCADGSVHTRATLRLSEGAVEIRVVHVSDAPTEAV